MYADYSEEVSFVQPKFNYLSISPDLDLECVKCYDIIT